MRDQTLEHHKQCVAKIRTSLDECGFRQVRTVVANEKGHHETFKLFSNGKGLLLVHTRTPETSAEVPYALVDVYRMIDESNDMKATLKAIEDYAKTKQ